MNFDQELAACLIQFKGRHVDADLIEEMTDAILAVCDVPLPRVTALTASAIGTCPHGLCDGSGVMNKTLQLGCPCRMEECEDGGSTD